MGEWDLLIVDMFAKRNGWVGACTERRIGVCEWSLLSHLLVDSSWKHSVVSASACEVISGDLKEVP